jgi:hypothetical protein
VGWSIFTKVLLQVVMEEVPRSRCANLIILFFLNGEKVPNDHNFLGCFSQLLKNKFTRLLNFITKNTVTTYLSTYYIFLIILVGMGIGNECKGIMALKRGCHQITPFTFLMNGHDSPPLSLVNGWI